MADERQRLLQKHNTSLNDDPEEVHSSGSRRGSGLFPYVPLPSIYDEDLQRDQTQVFIIHNPTRFPWEAVLLGLIFYAVCIFLLLAFNCAYISIQLSVGMPFFNDLIFQVRFKELVENFSK